MKVLWGILGGAALLYLGITIHAWYFPPAARTLYRVVQVPYVAKYSDVLENLEDITVPVPAKKAPVGKEKEKIEKKLGGELKPGDIITAAEIKKLPYGGTVVVTLEPGKLPVSTVYPAKQPFFEWINSREFSAYGGVGSGLQTVLGLELRQDLFRTGPAVWNARIGVLSLPAQVTPYAVVGVSVKF